MAERLSRIHGTEQDRVNCSFFFKMGACRHGDKCDRRHNRPTESPTVLFTNMYQTAPTRLVSHSIDNSQDGNEDLKFLDEFYEDIFVELSKYGEIEDLNICANPGQHLNGNVYVKFRLEPQASNAITKTSGRLYDGQPIKAELSPVTDFGEARCRQYAAGECDRKMCNFMHLREPSRRLRRQLFKWQSEQWHKAHPHHHPYRNRSISPRRRRPTSPRSTHHRHSDNYSSSSSIASTHHSSPMDSHESHLNNRSRILNNTVDPFGRDVDPHRDTSKEEEILRKQLIEVQQARRLHESQDRSRKRERSDPFNPSDQHQSSITSNNQGHDEEDDDDHNHSKAHLVKQRRISERIDSDD